MKLKSYLTLGLALYSFNSFSLMRTWTTSLGAGADISTFDSANTQSGVGYYAELRQKYYFSDHVGLFSGFQFVQRKLSFQEGVLTAAESSGAAKYMEVPLGISFQYGAWGSGLGSADIGMTYAIPLSDYSISSTTYDSKSHMNLFLSFTTSFPVDDDFYLGFNLGYKYALGNSVEDPVGTGSKGRDFNFGLVANFTYD